MRLILLPGMGGTGQLFDPLLAILPKEQEATVISYPKNQKKSWEELIELILSQLSQEDFLLVGESYSGYLAYRVAQRKPPHLKAVLFVATFSISLEKKKRSRPFLERTLFSIQTFPYSPSLWVAPAVLGFWFCFYSSCFGEDPAQKRRNRNRIATPKSPDGLHYFPASFSSRPVMIF